MSETDKQIRILHLSDIHLGTSDQAKNYFTQLATDLTQNLKVKQLNYLVLSGDIANYSTVEEYDAAFELVDKLVKRYGLNPDRVITVPGNHDLNWDLSKKSYDFVYKNEMPKSLAEGQYIDAGDAGVLIRDEERYQQRFKHFSDRFYKKVYSKPYPLEYDKQAILHPCPDDKILFLALNSCWELDHHYKDRASINSNAISHAVEQILEKYDDWLKIAVWHHPVTSAESMENVAFLEQLAVNGFQVAMHGHIHEAKDENFQYDTNRGLGIIAAGTFGAPKREQVTGIPLQYNLLVLDPDNGELTVETRKKEKVDGAWSADARWGDKNNPSSNYTFKLRYYLQNDEDLSTINCSDNDSIQRNQRIYFHIPSDFLGRKSELNQLERLLEDDNNRVILVTGISGIGKSYLSRKFTGEITNKYKTLFLENYQDFASLSILFTKLKIFLNEHGIVGFDTSYSEDRMGDEVKILSFLTTINSRIKKDNYCIIIDYSQKRENIDSDSHPFKKIELFIKIFAEYTSKQNFKHKLILFGDFNTNLLKYGLLNKIKEINLYGLNKKDASEYIANFGEFLKLDLSQEDIDKIIKKTEGHPMAINMIVKSCEKTSLETILDNLVGFDRVNGKFLKEIVNNTEKGITQEESKALHKLSIFETPFDKRAWEYFGIDKPEGESLLRWRLLTIVNNNQIQVHGLFKDFWRNIYFHDNHNELIELHLQAAKYYWQEGTRSVSDNIDKLDRIAYIQAHYHFINSNEHNLAAEVINELIYYIYQQEPLLSEKLSELTEWIMDLDNTLFDDKPWLLLEKGQRVETNNKIDKEKAESIFRKAYKIFIRKKDELGQSIALYYIGKLLSAKKAQKDAIEELNKVLEISINRGDFKMQIRTLGKLINCHKDLGQYDIAWTTAVHAEKLAKDREPLGYALIMYRKGGIRRSESKFHEAEDLFKKSEKAFNKLGDLYRTSKSLSRLGIVQERQGNYDEAKLNLEKAVEIKKDINDQYGLAIDLDYLAGVYRSRGDYEEATNKYQESLKIKEKINDIYGRVKTYNNLARIALSIANLSEVQRNLSNSSDNIKILKKKQEKYAGVYGSYFILLGDFNLKKGNYREAIQAYRQANKLLKNKTHDQARINLSLGEVYLKIRHIENARKYLEQSLLVFKGESNNQNKTPYHEALCLTYLAELKTITGNIKKAKQYNEEAMKLAQSIHPLYRKCLDTQAFIKQIEILKAREFNCAIKLTKEEIIKSNFAPVSKIYEEAINILTQSNLKNQCIQNQYIQSQRAYLQIKKNLWLITVKIMFGIQNELKENDYYLLIGENDSETILKEEILKISQTLKILHSIQPFLAQQIAQQALKVFSPIAMRLSTQK